MNPLFLRPVLFWFIAFGALPLGFTRAAEGPVHVLTDVSYLGPERTEKLDLYLPASAGKKADSRHPALVWIHGGGFIGGGKAQGREKNVGNVLAAAGYVVASINYRMGPGSWPQDVLDSKNAVRFLRVRAAEYQVNPDRIAVGGGSAGGTLALLAGLTPDRAPYDPGSLYAGVSNRVTAIVDFYGAPNFLSRRVIGPGGKPTDQVRTKPVDNPEVFGGSSTQDPVFKTASAINYITAESPPVLICQGLIDPEVDYYQSVELAAALKTAGVRHELHLLPGVGHTFDLQTWKGHPLPEDLRPIVLRFLGESF